MSAVLASVVYGPTGNYGITQLRQKPGFTSSLMSLYSLHCNENNNHVRKTRPRVSIPLYIICNICFIRIMTRLLVMQNGLVEPGANLK